MLLQISGFTSLKLLQVHNTRTFEIFDQKEDSDYEDM